MQGIQHTLGRLIETTLCDGVNRTRNGSVANLLYDFELIITNNVDSTKCKVLNIQSDD